MLLLPYCFMLLTNVARVSNDAAGDEDEDDVDDAAAADAGRAGCAFL